MLTEGKARPERWAEVLSLTCGRLPANDSDALVQRVTGEGSTALLLRVVADAEGLSSETVRGALKMEAGWAEDQLRARQRLIEEIPALVGDLAVAVGLLEQVAKSTTCGHDLFWVREVLRRIERGEIGGEMNDRTGEDARRAAKGVASNVLGHLDPAKRAALLELLKPWWREIPAGSFEMGSTERNNEQPIHRVNFPVGFSILGVPVTWAMYCLFDPHHTQAQDTFDARLPIELQSDVPVYHVSWFAAVMFAEWAQAQLPLESEWEYACRAGTTTRFWSGDAEQDLAWVGWYSDFGGGGNSGGHPHPVAVKPANPWGLHDVHGNVWEWCLNVYDGDEYERRYRTSERSGSATKIEPGHPPFFESNTLVASRALRGGSWSNEPEATRSAVRLRYPPSAVFRYLGFRLARSYP
ncbi:formylglycine-generating enzyme family protein [Myxococcota bacterium]|nr:formylglycine-generating enzyme family protein [Myxococcota bacterium]